MGGGMSGMGGSARGGFGPDDDDDPMNGGGGNPFASFAGGMPGGMPRARRTNSRSGSGFRPSSPSGMNGSSSSPPNEITKPLKVSLEELYTGATKKLKVGRRLLDGSNEDKVLEIQVLPGWKSGTKIRFPKAGNEQMSGESQDLVFVVEEKPHDRFTRDGNDLITNVKIPLVDALTGEGGRKIVEVLDKRKVGVPVPGGVVKPGQETRIRNEGMPIRKSGTGKTKGDLVVKWDVVFPERLTPSQKEGVKKVLG